MPTLEIAMEFSTCAKEQDPGGYLVSRGRELLLQDRRVDLLSTASQTNDGIMRSEILIEVRRLSIELVKLRAARVQGTHFLL